MTRRWGVRWAIAGAMIVAAVGIYAPSVGYELILDDPLVTVLNQDVAADRPAFGRFFVTSLYAGTGFENQNNNLYRPLSKSSFALDYLAAGGRFDPRRMRWINVLLYGLSAALVFELVLLLAPGAGAVPRATATAFLFLVLPSHLETVCSIKHREEILALLFGLLAWLVVEKTRATGRWASAVLAGGLFLLALLSKESAILLLGVLLLRHWALARGDGAQHRYPRFVWTFLGASVAYAALRWNALGTPLSPPGTRSYYAAEVGIVARVFASSETFLRYYVWDQFVGLKLNPALSSPFVIAHAPVVNASNTLSFVLVAGVVAASILLWLRRESLLAFALAFFGLTSLLTLHAFPIGTAGAFRLQFTPSFGLALALVLAIERSVARLEGRLRPTAGAILCAVLVVFYASVTRDRMPIFANNGALFDYAAAVEPRDPMSPAAAGRYWDQKQDPERKLERYGQSLARFQSYLERPELFDERAHDALTVVATEVALARVDTRPSEALQLADLAILEFDRLRVLRAGLTDSNAVARTDEAIAVSRQGLAIAHHRGLADLLHSLGG